MLGVLGNDDTLTESLRLLGDGVIDLAERPARWILRQIDEFEPIDDVTMSVSSTIDIDLAGYHGTHLPSLPSGELVLPVKGVARRQSVAPTVTDAAGVSLPTLTRRIERSLVAAGLLQTQASAVGRRPELYAEIRSVLDEDLFGPERPIADPSRFLEPLLRFYDEYHLVLAVLPPTAATAITRVVVQHNAAMTRPEQPGLGRLTSILEADVSRVATVVESWHGRFGAPPDTAIASALLTDATGATLARDDSGSLGEAHLYLSRGVGVAVSPAVAADNARAPVSSGLFLRVTLLPRRRWSSRIASWLGTATLVAVTCSVGWNDAGWPGIPVRFGPDVQSLVAALLLGPTLFATMLIREEEHPLTKRVLLAQRIRLFVHASTTFTAAMLYGLGVPGEARGVVLVALTVASAISTTLMERSWHEFPLKTGGQGADGSVR